MADFCYQGEMGFEAGAEAAEEGEEEGGGAAHGDQKSSARAKLESSSIARIRGRPRGRRCRGRATGTCGSEGEHHLREIE